jgi:hypothetical protein
MKKNANRPINPIVNSDGFPSDWDAVKNPDGKSLFGLTKREYMATMALQGLLAGKYKGLEGNDDTPAIPMIATVACQYADCLLKELEKSKIR